MNTETLFLQHERVDDIPLLWGVMEQLNLPQILERHLGDHHLNQGLSYGQLACAWLAFILSEADHRKVTVRAWANTRQHTLETLLGQSIRPVDFTDDRLGIVLRRFAEADWEALENDLWQDCRQVYALPIEGIRIDTSTTSGHHDVVPNGLMQFGHSKDHRPDLPQIKLVAAVAAPSSYPLVTEVVPGNQADDGVYVPIMDRVRRLLQQKGLLHVGDCKMAALTTRADAVSHDDYYLVPLPRTHEADGVWDGWIEQALAKDQVLETFRRRDARDEDEAFGRGYEFTRERVCDLEGKTWEWTERVQVIQSFALAEKRAQELESRLQKATAAVQALTPPVGRGHRQIEDEETLRAGIAAILERHEVQGLLTVKWERQEQRRERYLGRGRSGPRRRKQVEVKVRYAISEVKRKEAAIAAVKARLGWRVQVTNLPVPRGSLAASVWMYNGGWSVERDFHMVKSPPLGIQPMYVEREDQILGLTRLVMIGLRILTWIEVMIRNRLATTGEKLVGLFEGNPKQGTSRPTAVRLLRSVARMEITLTRVETPGGTEWRLTGRSPLLDRILDLLGLSPDLYENLVKDLVKDTG